MEGDGKKEATVSSVAPLPKDVVHGRGRAMTNGRGGGGRGRRGGDDSDDDDEGTSTMVVSVDGDARSEAGRRCRLSSTGEASGDGDGDGDSDGGGGASSGKTFQQQERPAGAEPSHESMDLADEEAEDDHPAVGRCRLKHQVDTPRVESARVSTP